MSFDSLEKALKGRFNTPFYKLPAVLRQRVERVFPPLGWDNGTLTELKATASRWDYNHNPATKKERRYQRDLLKRLAAVEKAIKECEQAVVGADVTDRKKWEASLVKLKMWRAKMKEKLPRANDRESEHERPLRRKPSDFIPYQVALELLAARTQATPQDFAAWIFKGPERRGLNAYTNVNEFSDPPLFHYVPEMGSDYIAPLMGCWFLIKDIKKFKPADHYITGSTLIDRWSRRANVDARKFIYYRIGESRLDAFHPISGLIQWSHSWTESFPPPEFGLFPLSHVEWIEAVHFPEEETGITPSNVEQVEGENSSEDESDMKMKSHRLPSVKASTIKLHFVVKSDPNQNDEWWNERMRAANKNGLGVCRPGKKGKSGPGGSLWYPDQVAGWLVDHHHLTVDAARVALKKFADYAEIADERFAVEL